MHPAVHVRIDPAGRTEWFDAAGHRHRLTGPAVVHADGTEEWYLHGEHHREDGPSFTHAVLGRHWLQNGTYHRLDGPAIEGHAEQPDEWYVNGVCVSERPEDQFALANLLSREPQLLPHVLSLYEPEGPTVAELVAAVRAAHA